MGVTPEKLLNSAKHYVSILNKEESKFIDALKNQRQKQVVGKEDELKRLQKEVKAKEAKIEQLKKEIETDKKSFDKIKDGINKSAAKVEKTNDRFMHAYKVVLGQIMTDVENMQKPEGIVGGVVLGGMILGGAWLVTTFVGSILAFLTTTVGLVVGLSVLGLIIFMALDSKTRAVTGFMYKSIMRWITGMFIKIDPISILKSYVDDLKGNLKKMNKRIYQLRGQMHKLKEMILNNKKEIKSNIELAGAAKANEQKAQMILKSRKAGRLRDSNVKLEDLYTKMEVLYRVLNKMHENSAILVEDVTDQVMVKEQERKAITAGNSAMKSAMAIIKGDTDKRAMFDQALEAIADDVSNKVGEMERFMDMSDGFMQSVDLQNGVFEEEGLKMLEKWENESTSLLLGDAKEDILEQANSHNVEDTLDLNEPIKQPEKLGRTNQYDNLFD